MSDQPLRIAIIGDSSSSAVGGCNNTYSSILFNQLSRLVTTKIVNFAVPGFTSTDARVLVDDVIRNNKYSHVIIYLGNNECCYSPKKGYKNAFWQWLSKNNVRNQENKLKDFYVRFANKHKFTYQYEKTSIANDKNEFYLNLRQIVKTCKKYHTDIILLNPIANKKFPAGCGLPNYLFFKVVDYQDKIAKLLKSCDSITQLLLQALSCYENNEFDDMLCLYNKILELSEDKLIRLIVKNNIYLHNYQSDPTLCINKLSSLLGVLEKYDAVIYYNLYLLAKKIGDSKEHIYLSKAYDSDKSTYRIKDAYRNVINRLSDEFSVNVIDLADIIHENEFVDYCHPTVAAHNKIAHQVYNVIADQKEELAPSKSNKSTFTSKLISPNYSYRKNENYIDYYYIDDKLDSEAIRHALKNISKSARHGIKTEENSSSFKNHTHLENCLINFFESNSRHPIFTSCIDFLSETMLPHSNEILVMPENYLFRMLYNYYKIYESGSFLKVNEYLAKIKTHLHDANWYKRCILSNAPNSLNMNVLFSQDYLESIILKLVGFMKQSDMFFNTIDFRRRTVIYWYTRESFRYGTVSYEAMLYNRADIDMCIESLFVIYLIQSKFGLLDDCHFMHQLVEIISNLIQTHTQFARLFIAYGKIDVSSYEKQLYNLECKFLHCLPETTASVF